MDRIGQQAFKPAGADELGRRSIDPAAVARLLREWREGDEVEQRETGEYLLRALDEQRPEDAKLFP